MYLLTILFIGYMNSSIVGIVSPWVLYTQNSVILAKIPENREFSLHSCKIDKYVRAVSLLYSFMVLLSLLTMPISFFRLGANIHVFIQILTKKQFFCCLLLYFWQKVMCFVEKLLSLHTYIIR